MIKRLQIIALIVCLFSGNQFITYCNTSASEDSLIMLYNSESGEKDSNAYFLTEKIYNSSSDVNTQLKYAKEGFLIASQLKKDSYKGASKLRIGIAYQKLGDLKSACSNILESIQYYKNIEYKAGIITAYSYLATLSTEREQFKEAIGYLDKVATYYKDSKDSVRYYLTLLNIGDIYRNLGDYKACISNSLVSLDYFESSGEKTGEGYALGNIGLSYIELDSLDKALDFLTKSLSVLEPLKDNYALSVYLEGLAKMYQNQGKFSEAETMAQKGLSLAVEAGLIEQIRDAYERLSKIYYRANQYEKAYEAQTQFVIYKDSLINEKNIREMEGLRRQFEIAQKQTEVDELKQKQRFSTVIGIALIVIVLLLSVLMFLLYKQYKRDKLVNKQLETQQKELEHLNKTKDQLFSIISHDLRSPIATFCSFLDVFDTMLEDNDLGSLKQLSGEMKQSSGYIMDLVENLFCWGINQKGEIPFQPDHIVLNECVDEVMDVLGVIANNKKIKLTNHIPSSVNMVADCRMLQAIVRNLVNNALKFTPSGGEVVISASQNQEETSLSVADTGVGIEDDRISVLFDLDVSKSTPGTNNEKGVGLGLRLVHEFVEKHGGKIEVNSQLNKGTEIVVCMPNQG